MEGREDVDSTGSVARFYEDLFDQCQTNYCGVFFSVHDVKPRFRKSASMSAEVEWLHDDVLGQLRTA